MHWKETYIHVYIQIYNYRIYLFLYLYSALQCVAVGVIPRCRRINDTYVLCKCLRACHWPCLHDCPCLCGSPCHSISGLAVCVWLWLVIPHYVAVSLWLTKLLCLCHYVCGTDYVCVFVIYCVTVSSLCLCHLLCHCFSVCVTHYVCVTHCHCLCDWLLSVWLNSPAGEFRGRGGSRSIGSDAWIAAPPCLQVYFCKRSWQVRKRAIQLRHRDLHFNKIALYWWHDMMAHTAIY